MLAYNARSLPSSASLSIDGAAYPVVAALHYTRDGLVERTVYGDSLGGSRAATTTEVRYDVRRRPVRTTVLRAPTSLPDPTTRPLGAVSSVADQQLVWDRASNLIGIRDDRPGNEWPAGHRPQSMWVEHDALYRVVDVEYDYNQDSGGRSPVDDATDWRSEQALVRTADPMRQNPAPLVSTAAEGRVASLTYEYDWLANLTVALRSRSGRSPRSCSGTDQSTGSKNPSQHGVVG